MSSGWAHLIFFSSVPLGLAMLSARTPSERGLNELSSPGLLLGQDAVRYDCLIKLLSGQARSEVTEDDRCQMFPTLHIPVSA